MRQLWHTRAVAHRGFGSGARHTTERGTHRALGRGDSAVRATAGAGRCLWLCRSGPVPRASSDTQAAAVWRQCQQSPGAKIQGVPVVERPWTRLVCSADSRTWLELCGDWARLLCMSPTERRGCVHAQVHPWVPRTWLASAREHGVLPLEYTFAPVDRGAMLGRSRHAPKSTAQPQAREP